jgi:hypothetical protein
MSHVRDHVPCIFARAHDVLVEQVPQLSDHVAASRVDHPLVELAARQLELRFQLMPRNSLQVTASAAPSRAGSIADVRANSAARSASIAVIDAASRGASRSSKRWSPSVVAHSGIQRIMCSQ